MGKFMAAMTFASKLNEDGSVIIPQEALDTLKLHPGDEIKIRIEGANGNSLSDQPDQAALQRKARRLFEAADRVAREPGQQLTDPQEAEWAQGVEEKARKMGLKL
jgi:bifunctional DNA-binding transcriptional regulator/antitoxin component of YhaV-PrlF toxin-antitoxin module